VPLLSNIGVRRVSAGHVGHAAELVLARGSLMWIVRCRVLDNDPRIPNSARLEAHENLWKASNGSPVVYAVLVLLAGIGLHGLRAAELALSGAHPKLAHFIFESSLGLPLCGFAALFALSAVGTLIVQTPRAIKAGMRIVWRGLCVELSSGGRYHSPHHESSRRPLSIFRQTDEWP
jgi:hypothetical protein